MSEGCRSLFVQHFHCAAIDSHRAPATAEVASRCSDDVTVEVTPFNGAIRELSSYLSASYFALIPMPELSLKPWGLGCVRVARACIYDLLTPNSDLNVLRWT